MGVPAKTPKVCALCGRPIAIGEPENVFLPSSSFTDDAYLVRQPQQKGLHICQFCAPLVEKPGLIATQSGLFTKDAAFSSSKKTHKKWLLQNVEHFGEMVWTQNNTKMGHVAWKAPVCIYPLLYIQVGTRTIRCDMSIVAEAILIYEKYAEAWLAAQSSDPNKGSKTAKKGARNRKIAKPILRPKPFIRGVDAKFSETNAGGLRPDLEQYLSTEEVQTLRTLGMGEVWALGLLTNPDIAPETPDRIRIKQP
jgi:CRISPR type IV-associated protein Csf1